MSRTQDFGASTPVLRLGLRRPLPSSRPHRTSSLPSRFLVGSTFPLPLDLCASGHEVTGFSIPPERRTPLSPSGSCPEFCHSPCVRTPGSRWDSLPLADPSRCLLLRRESEGGRLPAAAGRRLGRRCSCWTGSTACWPRWGCAGRWPRSSSSVSIALTRPSSSTFSRTRWSNPQAHQQRHGRTRQSSLGLCSSTSLHVLTAHTSLLSAANGALP